MPVIPPITTPLTPILSTATFANQVLPNPGKPYVQQQNFGQMVGNVMSWNPDIDAETIKQQLNAHIRKIYDRRTWFGLMVRGQIATQKYILGGSCTLTQGTNLVQGINTVWDYNVLGRQFRMGYNSPPYTIIQVDPTNQVLALEMPWAAPSISPASYFIQQNYYSLGPNIKYIHTAKNLLQAWRLRLDYNQQSLDAIDPWRVSTFTPQALVQMPPGPNGEYMVELYPSPAIVQPLPFIAVVQPPNLIYDGDSLPPYIRCDILVKFGIADALVYRGKQNQYYDPAEAGRLRGEAEQELAALALSDENLYRQDLKYKWEEMRMAPDLGGSGGGFYAVNHGVMAGDGWGGWGDW